MATPQASAIPLLADKQLTRKSLGRGVAAHEIDWDKWSRHIELRRRRLHCDHPFEGLFSSRNYLATASFSSFRLEGLDITATEVAAALAVGRDRRAFRSRQAQRIRNHVAALRVVDALVLAGRPLDPQMFIRWYTSISCGLCPGDLHEATRQRLGEYVHRINFPELRYAAAIQAITRLHLVMLTDPLVPSFNGILCRLLLRFHLGRCGFPPVIFHPDTPPAHLAEERYLLPVIMESIEDSYDVLLAA